MSNPVIHAQGRAKRALGLIQVPMYFVYSSQTIATPAPTTVRTNSLLLGARRVSTQVLVAQNNQAVTGYTLVGTDKYVSYSSSNLTTLADAGVNKILVEGYLDTSVVAVSTNINSLFLVSFLSGVSPSSKEILSYADIQGATYVIEAVHAFTSSITTSADVSKKIQLVLEV